jgi:hypothetical protein
MTLAAIDRLVHRATILELNVGSYRRRTAVERRKGPGRPPTRATIGMRKRFADAAIISAGAALRLSS